MSNQDTIDCTADEQALLDALSALSHWWTGQSPPAATFLCRAEVEAMLAPLVARIEALEATVRVLRARCTR